MVLYNFNIIMVKYIQAFINYNNYELTTSATMIIIILCGLLARSQFDLTLDPGILSKNMKCCNDGKL